MSFPSSREDNFAKTLGFDRSRELLSTALWKDKQITEIDQTTMSTCSSDSFDEEEDFMLGETEDSESDFAESQVSEEDFDSTLICLKRNLVASLMGEFYAIFDPKWQGSMRTLAGSSGASPTRSSNVTGSESSPPRGLQKRKMDDRDSPPPGKDDNNDPKRPKSKAIAANPEGESLDFACPFHKHNPQKYCTNKATGRRFRTCAGPGWDTVSRVK